MNETTDIQHPEWVKWLAQDSDGRWWGYSVEPLQHSKGWYENEVGQYILLKKDQPNTNWNKTLHRTSS